MRRLDSVVSLEAATIARIGSLAFATKIGIVIAVEAIGERYSIGDFIIVGCFVELASQVGVQLERFEEQLPLRVD